MKRESICFVSPKKGNGKLIGYTYLLLGYACMPFVLLFFSLIQEVVNDFCNPFLPFVSKCWKGEDSSLCCINYLNDERNEVIIVVVYPFYFISSYFCIFATQTIVEANMVTFDGQIVFFPQFLAGNKKFEKAKQNNMKYD